MRRRATGSLHAAGGEAERARTACHLRLRARRPRRDRRSRVRRRVYPRQAPPLTSAAIVVIADTFFDSRPPWALARNLGLFVVVVFWLATAFWVFKDARRRIDDPWLVGDGDAARARRRRSSARSSTSSCARPSIEDVRERELENRAIEERLAERDLQCPVCRGAVEASFLVCPVCTTRLKQACAGCGSPLEPIWQVCPYCATPVPPRRATATTLEPLAPRGARASPSRLASALPRLWLSKPHSSSSSRTASAARSAARSSPASSVAATSCAAPGC